MFALAIGRKKSAPCCCAIPDPGFKNDEARKKWNQTAHRQADTLEKRGLGAAPKAPDGVRHHSADCSRSSAARGYIDRSMMIMHHPQSRQNYHASA